MLSTMVVAIALASGSDSMTAPVLAPLLMGLDREVSGLMDAYLEAVPECPVREDTPVRLWLLDLAAFRASAAISRLHAAPCDGVPEAALKSYLASCESYIRLYAGLQEFYHGGGYDDPARSMELESLLIRADSVWLASGAALFGAMGEKEQE